MNCRLAVILAADLAGYTSLMQSDQARAIALVQSLRDTWFEPKIAAGGGEVLKRMGDGWIVAFGSVSAAVEAAMAVQVALAGHPAISLRIAIHLGDIVEDQDDIYGAGINIAARLQADGPPGGIIVSVDLHRQLDEAVGDKFAEIGPLTLKNVKAPMPAFLWRPDAARQGADRAVPVIAVEPVAVPAGEGPYAEAAEEIRDRLVGDLSRRTGVRVVAAGLGPGEQAATYAVRGRLARRGPDARLSLSLINCADGSPVWSDTWTRPEDDLPLLCDLAVEAANAELRLAINALDAVRFASVPDDRLGPSELRSRAAHQIYQVNIDALRYAGRLIARALELDPDNGMSLAMKSEVDMWLTIGGVAGAAMRAAEAIAEDADRAVEILPTSDYAAYVRAETRIYLLGDLDGARRELARLNRINPGFHLALEIEGIIRIASGDFAAGAVCLRACNARSPRDPYVPQRLYIAAAALFLGGDAEGAAAAIAEAVELRPSCRVFRHLLALAEAAAGRPEAAARARQAVERLAARPDLMAPRLPFSDPMRVFMDQLFAKAGV